MRNQAVAVAIILFNVMAGNLFADPMLTSWYTKNAGQYARIQQTTGGSIVTTWTGQTSPTYADVEVVSYSSNYVYVYTGGVASSVTEPVTTNFTGGANAALNVTAVNADGAGDVTLTWSSVQGGTYVISGSVNMVTWTNLNPSVTATGIVSQGTDPAAAQTYTQRFYKVGLTSLATYDP